MGLLNRKHTRDYILKQVKIDRPGWAPTQVSPAFLTGLERKLKKMIDRAVHAHPSRGKTIKEML